MSTNSKTCVYFIRLGRAEATEEEEQERLHGNTRQHAEPDAQFHLV